jgi:hypothetical protein
MIHSLGQLAEQSKAAILMIVKANTTFIIAAAQRVKSTLRVYAKFLYFIL